MLAFLKPYWLTIAKWGGIVLGVLLVLVKVRQSGKDAVRVENLEKGLEDAKTSNEIEDAIAGTPIDKQRDELSKWNRDQ